MIDADRMISLREAAALGLDRIRRPLWAAREDHLKIDILEGGQIGFWVHLFSPFNKECNGRDPVSRLLIGQDLDAREFIPHTGPLPDSAEYRAAVAVFDGCLKRA